MIIQWIVQWGHYIPLLEMAIIHLAKHDAFHAVRDQHQRLVTRKFLQEQKTLAGNNIKCIGQLRSSTLENCWSCCHSERYWWSQLFPVLLAVDLLLELSLREDVQILIWAIISLSLSYPSWAWELLHGWGWFLHFTTKTIQSVMHFIFFKFGTSAKTKKIIRCW